MSTPTDPPKLEPIKVPPPDGHTWYPQQLVQQQGWWSPPDPAHIDPTYPAWQLPTWYATRTGVVLVPGTGGMPGTSQYVWGGWLPWQAGAERYDAAQEWPTAVRRTVADMQADLFPPAPNPEPAPQPTTPDPVDEPGPAAPQTTPPTLGQALATAPEGS